MTGQRKRYFALMIYILTMAGLILSRITNFHVLWAFLITSVMLGGASFFLKGEYEGGNVIIQEKKKTVYSAMIFSAWFLAAIPLVLFGDYLAEKLDLGYEIGFLSDSLGSIVLWISVAVSSVAYELFFRRSIHGLFSEVGNNRLGAAISSVCFAVYFLDIRLVLAAVLLNYALLNIGYISRKNGILFSVLSSAAIVLLLTVISGESAGGVSVGVLDIIGMTFIFGTVAALVLYFARKSLEIEKPSLIEIGVVVLLSAVSLLLGALFVTL